MKKFLAAVILTESPGFTFNDIVEHFDFLRNSVSGLIVFLKRLPEVVIVLFPFLNTEQIAYMIFLLVALVTICAYFFVKKVF